MHTHALHVFFRSCAVKKKKEKEIHVHGVFVSENSSLSMHTIGVLSESRAAMSDRTLERSESRMVLCNFDYKAHTFAFIADAQ